MTTPQEAMRKALEAWGHTGKDMQLAEIMQRGDDLANALRTALALDSNALAQQGGAAGEKADKGKCSALIDRECKNGFFVTAVCSGISADKVLPMCCKEDLCGRLFHHNGGSPKLHHAGAAPAPQPAQAHQKG